MQVYKLTFPSLFSKQMSIQGWISLPQSKLVRSKVIMAAEIFSKYPMIRFLKSRSYWDPIGSYLDGYGTGRDSSEDCCLDPAHTLQNHSFYQRCSFRVACNIINNIFNLIPNNFIRYSFSFDESLLTWRNIFIKFLVGNKFKKRWFTGPRVPHNNCFCRIDGGANFVPSRIRNIFFS